MDAKEKVLRKVCCYTKEDEMMGHDDISISEAMEAMKEYHNLMSEEEKDMIIAVCDGKREYGTGEMYKPSHDVEEFYPEDETEPNEKLKEARQYIHHNGHNPYHVDKAIRIASGMKE